MCLHDFFFERELPEAEPVRTLSSGIKMGEPPQKKYKSDEIPKNSQLTGEASNNASKINTTTSNQIFGQQISTQPAMSAPPKMSMDKSSLSKT